MGGTLLCQALIVQQELNESFINIVQFNPSHKPPEWGGNVNFEMELLQLQEFKSALVHQKV